MKKVLCFGELLLRLSPAAEGVWLQENVLPVFMGGAELNVATALALWGHPVKYFTALPDNNVSKDIAAYLEQKQIDTSPVFYGGDRVGLYYLQQGTDMKGAGTVFDRKNSSFATLSTGKVDWDAVLEGVDWFHFSAIAPAVSFAAAELCKEALQAASKKNITISVDLNYRALLWKYDKLPAEIMPELVAYCSVIMGNLWAANTLLGVHVPSFINTSSTSNDYIKAATESAAQIFAKFPACKTVANTFRFDKAEGIFYYATLNTIDNQSVSSFYETEKVIDKVGSGDCFMAGLIYGICANHTNEAVINFAAAAAFAKLQEKGDTTKNDVKTILKVQESFQNSNF